MNWLIVLLLLISIAFNVILVLSVLANRSVIREGQKQIIEELVTARIAKKGPL